MGHLYFVLIILAIFLALILLLSKKSPSK
jgi:hypothetical protein